MFLILALDRNMSVFAVSFASILTLITDELCNPYWRYSRGTDAPRSSNQRLSITR